MIDSETLNQSALKMKLPINLLGDNAKIIDGSENYLEPIILARKLDFLSGYYKDNTLRINKFWSNTFQSRPEKVSCAYLPGHVAPLQDSTSVSSPTQLLPPFAGTGLSHDLLLFLIPKPQVTEHSAHSDHSLQLP